MLEEILVTFPGKYAFPFYWQFSEYSNCREWRSSAIKCESVKISQIIQFSRLLFDPSYKLLSILYKILNRSPSEQLESIVIHGKKST